MTQDRRCPMCDSWYSSTNQEEVKIHMHPEPQSGPPRQHLIDSGLDYDKWIVERFSQEWIQNRAMLEDGHYVGVGVELDE